MLVCDTISLYLTVYKQSVSYNPLQRVELLRVELRRVEPNRVLLSLIDIAHHMCWVMGSRHTFV